VARAVRQGTAAVARAVRQGAAAVARAERQGAAAAAGGDASGLDASRLRALLLQFPHTKYFTPDCVTSIDFSGKVRLRKYLFCQVVMNELLSTGNCCLWKCAALVVYPGEVK
jgi:hypothetical protein